MTSRRALILSVCGLVLVASCGKRSATTPAGAGEKDVLAALETWKKAMVEKDTAAFEKVLHPDLTYGHSSGLVETKAQAIRHVTTSKATYDAINFGDTRVRIHGDTALVTGKIELHQRSNDKVNVVNLVVLSAWVRGAEGWQMVARQSTRPTPQ